MKTITQKSIENAIQQAIGKDGTLIWCSGDYEPPNETSPKELAKVIWAYLSEL